MEIVYVYETDRVEAMRVENATSANVYVFDMIEYHSPQLFVRIEQIEDTTISLRDVSFLHVISLPASFHKYG